MVLSSSSQESPLPLLLPIRTPFPPHLPGTIKIPPPGYRACLSMTYAKKVFKNLPVELLRTLLKILRQDP